MIELTLTSVSTPSGWAAFVGVIVGRCHAKLGATLTLNLAMTLCSRRWPGVPNRFRLAGRAGPLIGATPGENLKSSTLDILSHPFAPFAPVSDAYRLQITDDRECLSLDPCLAGEGNWSQNLTVDQLARTPSRSSRARHAASHRNPLRNLSTRPSRCGLRTVTPARLSLPPLVIPDARAACWNGTALELTDMTDNGSVIWQKHTNNQL
ncbi:hypothetical protein CMUS01_06534 [Colletotrichum musicola]|uniref:Uncharacterized protein n=1 Tax=Colletotrichum musicola TaxID=2175873 RepID=A0A8H6KLG3_9PEZI|nr:hypothetical protein CMUS01_06534 [Colletotrichum musicola]